MTGVCELTEVPGAIPAQERVAGDRRGGAVEEDAGQHGGDGQCPLSTHSRDLHEQTSQKGARNAHAGYDQAVAVG